MSYKVFFLGRHGQGWREYSISASHAYIDTKILTDNVAETKYGTQASTAMFPLRFCSWTYVHRRGTS